MMSKLFLVVLMLVGFIACGYAQYNEKDILLQQANQMMAQRQYTQAEQLFLQILDKFPSDLSSILQLSNLYFSLSQTDKAEALLIRYQRAIPAQSYAELHIQLLVIQANISQAWQESMAYLDAYQHDEYKYRQLTSYFARKGFYDKMLELYQMARVKLNNPDLFRLEIANTAMSNRMFDTAIREYLGYLESNPVNLFFTINQLKIILEEDSTQISLVESIANKSRNPIIKEAYANALVSRRDFRSALQIYKQMELPKLYRFAEEQNAAGNDSIAFEAYSYLITADTDPIKVAEIRYRMAELRFHQADFTAAKTLLREALMLPLWKDRTLSYRSMVAVKLRKLMADNSLAMGEPPDSALAWLVEAKKFGRDNTEKQQIDLEIARLKIMTGDKDTALQILSSVNQPALNETRDYLSFLGALLFNETALADSLMNEYIIKYPASANANDAIYLIMLTLGLQAEDQQRFFSAIRLLQLNNQSGLDTLEVVFKHSKDEELQLLAIEWAIGFGNVERATELLNYEFTDPVAIEYVELIKMLLVKDKDEEQRIAREFLKAKPNSIFSPDFRQRISRMAASRPNL